MRTIVLAAALASLAGCAQVNHRNPNADYAADRWDCQQQVARLPPLAQSTPASYSTSCMKTGPSTQCESTPHDGGTFSSAWAAEERNWALPNCMRAKGWNG